MGSWSWTITGIIRPRSRPTLAAAKQGWGDRRLVVLFQPHRYTRTRDLLEDFAKAFDQSDVLFLTEIYAAGEQPIPGVSGAKLADIVRSAGHPAVTFVDQKDMLVDQVLPHLKSGDLVITLGAGDIWKTGLGLIGPIDPHRMMPWSEEVGVSRQQREPMRDITQADMRAAVAGFGDLCPSRLRCENTRSFKIGGPADVVVEPADIEDVCLVVQQARAHAGFHCSSWVGRICSSGMGVSAAS